MTVFSDTYDIVTPAGSDDPAEADDRMQEIKAAVQERENVDHYWPLTGTEVSDADAGEHRKVTLRTGSAPAAVADKGLVYAKDVGGKAELFYRDEDGNEVQITSGGILNSLNLAGAQTAAGVKTFSSIPKIPITAPTVDAEAAGKKYVDDQILAAIPVAARIKAWIAFNGTGTIAIRSSYNVSGITDNGTGDYTITWDTNFADDNYCVVGSAGGTDHRLRVGIEALLGSGGSTQIRVTNDAGALTDASIVCVMAIGTQ